MSGFENDVVFAKNADFSQSDNQSPVEANGLATNGQLWVGTTAVNAGGTHVNVGTVVSPDGSLTLGYTSPNITAVVGDAVATTYETDSGSATPAGNILNVLGDGIITTEATGNTITINSGSSLQGVIRGPDIDFTVTGNTELYTFTDDFIITGFMFINTQLTGTLNNDAAANIGWTAALYDDVGDGILGTYPADLAGENGFFVPDSIDFFPYVPAGETLRFNITQAESGASVYVNRVDVIGYYKDGNPPNPPSVPVTYTASDGGTATPALDNVNIFGRSGSKTTASGSTVTVKSPPYADEGSSTSVTLNSGSFATATITLTTPVSAGLADGELIEFVATTANVLTIQFAATQVGHIGNVASSVAGTFVSTAIGDAISLRYQASTNDWWAISVVGNWTIT